MMLGAIALVLVATCGQDAAAATPCPDADPQKVTAGEPAPCDGWAISEGDALHVAQTKAALDAERKAHDATRRESVVRIKAAEQKLLACDQRVGRLEGALDDCEKLTTPAVPWHESPEFVAPISAVAAAVVAVLVVVLVYETR
jgi:hypothetical protein